jgi:hypothetical protein
LAAALEEVKEAAGDAKRRRDEKPADQDHSSDGDDPPARERPAAGWMLCSRRVEHVVPAFGAGLGGTPQNVIPASHFILERSHYALEHGRDVLVIHRWTSVIAVLTFR